MSGRFLRFSLLVLVLFFSQPARTPAQRADSELLNRILVKIRPTGSDTADKKLLDLMSELFEPESIRVSAGTKLADLALQRCGRVDRNWIALTKSKNPNITGDRLETEMTVSAPPCPYWKTKAHVTIPRDGTLSHALLLHMGAQGKHTLDSVAGLNKRSVDSLDAVKPNEQIDLPYSTTFKPYVVKEQFRGQLPAIQGRLAESAGYLASIPAHKFSLIVAASNSDCAAPADSADWPFSAERLSAVLRFNDSVRPEPIHHAVVAVADTGLEEGDDRLFLNRNTREVLNGIDDDQNGFVDDLWGANMDTDKPGFPSIDEDYEFNEHGTHVAGIALGTLKDSGLNSLVKERVAIRPINIVLRQAIANGANDPILMFPIPNDFLIDAFQYASVGYDPPANIINLSVESDQMAGLDSVLVGKAMLVVAAAGNDGLDIDETPRYPAAAASRDLLVTVAAHDGNGKLASFSNWGKNLVDLAAPGCQIDSTLPGSKRGRISGTSQAAPFVSFTAALLYSEGLTYRQIKDRILLTTDLDHTNLGTCEGEAGHCVGSEGRLNVVRALEVYQDVVVIQKASGERLEMAGLIKDACISLDGRCYDVRTQLKRLVHEPGSNQAKVWINSSDNRVLSRQSQIMARSVTFQSEGQPDAQQIAIGELVDLISAVRPRKLNNSW